MSSTKEDEDCYTFGPTGDRDLYCKICNFQFSSFEDLVKHKIKSPKHEACVFCGSEFRTKDGRKRHQDEMHAAEQNLKCRYCQEEFVRAGSYISHLEMRLCPVIHKGHLKRLQAEKSAFRQELKDLARDQAQRRDRDTQEDKAFGDGDDYSVTATDMNIPLRTSSRASTTMPFFDARLDIFEEMDDGEDLLVFEDSPKRPAWGLIIDEPMPKPILQTVERIIRSDTYRAAVPDMGSDVPALSAKSKTPVSTDTDLVSVVISGKPDELDMKNRAWVDGQNMFESSAPKSILPTIPAPMRPSGDIKEDDWHELDPGNPEFRAGDHRNKISGLYNCPWPRCKAILKTTSALTAHLRSAAHMDTKLRCPSCLRIYFSYTAFVQHGESQAKKCRIRNSTEYRYALHQVSASLITTDGRHKDDNTVKYKMITHEQDVAAMAAAKKQALARTEEAERKKAERLANIVW